ncbi:hypothetical protein L3Q82_015985 [Xyrichtys novacula]|uniref:Uncharacterized protein n=1 Tax=Xyrichtys novacula TaxID=13765 RepID=A0AAV1HG42_XYRNO|nr:hypothetical protein L3Q82_015985 [Xyrichtys novacula]
MGVESLVVDVRQSHKAKRLLPVLIQPPPPPPLLLLPPLLPPPGLQHCSPLDSSRLDILSITLHGPFKSFNGSKIYLCSKKYWEFTTSSTGGIYGYLASRFVAGSGSSAAQIPHSLLTATDEPCVHRLHLQTFGPKVRSKNREAAVYVDWC